MDMDMDEDAAEGVAAAAAQDAGEAAAGDPWLEPDELAAWVRLVAVVELLPGVLDTQLRQDAELTHFDYYVLAMLSEAPQRTLRMTDLARTTNATLPRLSHVVRRLEQRGLVARSTCPGDRRATNAALTEQGWDAVREAAPGHAATVRRSVFDALGPEQVRQLDAIAAAILSRLDPHGSMKGTYDRYGRAVEPRDAEKQAAEKQAADHRAVENHPEETP